MASRFVTQVFPTFLIVGAPRSGTTSIRAHLARHPDVAVSPTKELRYFHLRYERGPAWYAKQFAFCEGALAVGESTPAYMYSDAAIERIRQDLPDVRLILILRDPAERAYSHYWKERRRGRDPHDQFEAAIAARALYVHGGLYVDRLRALEASFDREQILVLLTRDLAREPRRTLGSVCTHLGIDPSLLPDDLAGIANRAAITRSQWVRRLVMKLPRGSRRRDWLRSLNKPATAYPPMRAETRRELVRFYEPSIAELEEWLGADLDEWRRVDPGEPDRDQRV